MGKMTPGRACIPPTLLFLHKNGNAPVLLQYGIVLKNYLAFLSRIYSPFIWGIYFRSWAWLRSWEESPLAVERLLLIKGSCDIEEPVPIPEALSWCLQFISLTGLEILWVFPLFVWGSVLFCGDSRPTTVYHLLGLLRDCRNRTYWGSALNRGGISALVSGHDMRSAVTFKKASSVSQGSW